jgi:hypothetical protein
MHIFSRRRIPHTRRAHDLTVLLLVALCLWPHADPVAQVGGMPGQLPPSGLPGQPPPPGGISDPSMLGPLTFFIAPGSNHQCPPDSRPGSLLKVFGSPSGGLTGTVCSGTLGNFTPGPLTLFGGAPNERGVAGLTLQSPVVIGAYLRPQSPECGGACIACWRFEQDPRQQGWVDCNGNSNADATLLTNSRFVEPSALCGALAVSNESRRSGPGAAVVRVFVQRLRLSNTSICPGVTDLRWRAHDVAACEAALVTGEATSIIQNPQRCPGQQKGLQCPGDNPYRVSLSGSNLSCKQWATQGNAQLAVAFHHLGETIDSIFGAGDIAQVLRFTQHPSLIATPTMR